VALEGYAASRSAAERHKLAQRYPALADFVPSLGFGRQGDRFADRSGEDQLYLVPAIVRLLTDLAKTRPVVIVLGDLNGLDRSSLSLLGYLAPLAADRRWLIVGTYGEDALAPGSELRRMVDATERERLSVRIELERLARRDCDALVRALLPGRSVDPCLLDQVFERSLGNPLFIEELVREMSSAASPGVPSSVRARVAQRVADVDQNVRRVLALAAAGNGKGITFAALRTGAAALHPPLSEVAVLDALDRALELRILEERNGSYAFRHPLVRSALYESLSTHRRDELNAALGRSRATGP
jgi:predicted ATPase